MRFIATYCSCRSSPSLTGTRILKGLRKSGWPAPSEHCRDAHRQQLTGNRQVYPRELENGSGQCARHKAWRMGYQWWIRRRGFFSPYPWRRTGRSFTEKLKSPGCLPPTGSLCTVDLQDSRSRTLFYNPIEGLHYRRIHSYSWSNLAMNLSNHNHKVCAVSKERSDKWKARVKVKQVLPEGSETQRSWGALSTLKPHFLAPNSREWWSPLVLCALHCYLQP